MKRTDHPNGTSSPFVGEPFTGERLRSCPQEGLWTRKGESEWSKGSRGSREWSDYPSTCCLGGEGIGNGYVNLCLGVPNASFLTSLEGGPPYGRRRSRTRDVGERDVGHGYRRYTRTTPCPSTSFPNYRTCRYRWSTRGGSSVGLCTQTPKRPNPSGRCPLPSPKGNRTQKVSEDRSHGNKTVELQRRSGVGVEVRRTQTRRPEGVQGDLYQSDDTFQGQRIASGSPGSKNEQSGSPPQLTTPVSSEGVSREGERRRARDGGPGSVGEPIRLLRTLRSPNTKTQLSVKTSTLEWSLTHGTPVP